MARVILTPGETFTVFNSTASVEGGSGSEKLLIGGTSSAVTVSQTVERVDLSGNLADYTFKAVGNSVEVRSGGTVVATIGVQDDSNGSLVAFADGSGYLNYATTGTAIQLGGATISTSTAGAITIAQVGNFDTTTKSGSSSLGGTTSTNQTFTLTTGLNNLAGGTGNDFFDASTTLTLNTFDTLDGSTGTDTLFASVGATAAPTLSNIEALQFSATADATIDLSSSSGYTSIENTGSTGVLTVQNISTTAPALKLSNTSKAATFVWQDAGVVGTADSVTLTLSNVTSAPLVTIAGVETVNVVSSTASNSVNLSSVAATTVKVSGSAALTVNTVTGGVKSAGLNAATTTFDWTQSTGAVTVIPNAATTTLLGGSGNDSIDGSGISGKYSISGGAGDDTIVGGILVVGDTVDGGAGTDILTSTSAGVVAISASTTPTVTNVERLALTDLFSGSVDLSKIGTSITTFNIPLTTSLGTGAITSNSGSTTLNLGTSGAGNSAGILGTGTLSISAAGSGASDSLTINNIAVNSTAPAANLNVFNGQNISLTGFETVGLSTGTATSGTGANTIGVLTVNPNATGTSTAGQTLSVTASGTNALTVATLASGTNTGILSFDASSLTASSGTFLRVSAATGSALASITGSAGNDAINTGNLTSTIDGGAGNDTITAGTGNDSIRGGTGADSITVGTGNDSVDGGTGDDTIDGGADNDSILGGDGNDSITAGAGNDTLSGGAGDDTFVMAGNLTAADSILGGDGSDTLSATINGLTATTGAFNITGVETLNLDTGSATRVSTSANTISAAALSGVTNFTFAGTQDVTLTNLANGTTVGLGFAASPTYSGTMTVSLATDTASDSLRFALGNTANNGVNATLATATTGIESMTIVAGATESATLGVSGLVTPALTVTGGLAGKTLSLRGGSALLSATTTTVDASAFVGTLAVAAGQITGTAGTAITVRGASGGDTLVGGVGNDTFNVTNASSSNTYSIDGGAGNDSLNLTLSTGGTSLNATSITGVENIAVTLPTASAFSSATTTANAAQNNGFNTATKLTFTGGSTVSTSTLTLGSSANGVAIGGSTLTNFDASGFAGTVDLNVSTGAAALFTGGSIKSGSGTSDVLRYTVSSTQGFTGITAGSVSGFESLVITTTNTSVTPDTASHDLSNVTGVNTITVGGGNSYTLNGLAAGVALKLGDDSSSSGVTFADNKTLTANWTTVSTASDSATINLGRAGTVSSGITLSLPGIENVTLTQSALTNGTAFGLKIQDTNTNNVAITINGGLASRALTFVSGALQSNVSTISATGFAGNLVMDGNSRQGSGAMTITGGNGNDTIVMKNASDSLVGGSGNDTLILSVAGNDKFTFDLSAADQVVTWNGDSNSAIQSGFENLDARGIIGSTLGVKVLAGAAAGSNIIGTDYSDTINGGAGNDTVTGGAGVDYIDISQGGKDSVAYTATGQTLSSNSSSSWQSGGILSGDFLGVTGVLGVDLITGMTRGDTLQISTLTSSNSPTFFNRGFSTTGLIASSSNSNAADAIFQMSKGNYIGTGLWTFDANGNDVLFQWDTNGSPAAGSYIESVVLIGSASSFTGITANSAGVILFT